MPAQSRAAKAVTAEPIAAKPFASKAFSRSPGARPGSTKAAAPLSLWVDPEPCAPPPMSVVAAVLQFGDLREEQEDGTTLVRLSASRIEREDLRLLLGADRHRALDVSIVWDEDEAEVLRIVDLAPLRPPGGPNRRNRYAEARMRRASGEMLAA